MFVVDEDEKGSFLAADEGGDHLAVVGHEDGGAEGDVDVAAGVEQIFDEPFHATEADAVELRADLGTFTPELVADAAGDRLDDLFVGQ